MNTYLVMTQQSDRPTVVEADLVDLTDPQMLEFRRKEGPHFRVAKKDVLWWDIHYLTTAPRAERLLTKDLVAG